jgi:hypothetical protein
VKIGTIDHPKTRKMELLTGLCPNHVLGILEHFNHWVCRNAPQGDIGKWCDEQIEIGIAPELGNALRAAKKKPATLVWVLTEAGFVDQAPPPWRLIVHDWPEHCEQRVKKYLQRNGLRFAEEEADEADAGWRKRKKSGRSMENVPTPCPDNGRTPCLDKVSLHARVTGTGPGTGTGSGIPDTPNGYPKSFPEWFDQMRSMHPDYQKIKQGVAERIWMVAQGLVKNLPAELVLAAWQKFGLRSAENPSDNPCSTWITFLENAAPREGGGFGSGRGGAPAAAGRSEQDGMVVAADVDEGDAERRRLKRTQGAVSQG